IAYVKAKGIPVQATLEKPYSTDRNLWHCSHEGGILEDPSGEAPEHIFVMTKSPLDAPGKPVVVQIGFEEGTPVSVDHVPLGAVVTSTQQRVTGTVGLKLYKGSVTVAGRESPHALYQPSYATFGKDNVYNQKDAEGFIHLYGLAIKIGAGLDAVRREQDAVA